MTESIWLLLRHEWVGGEYDSYIPVSAFVTQVEAQKMRDHLQHEGASFEIREIPLWRLSAFIPRKGERIGDADNQAQGT